MENMRVCWRCRLGIECKEGRQPYIIHAIDPEEPDEKCDWCGQTANEGGFE